MQEKEEYREPAVEFLEIDDVVVASNDPNPGSGPGDDGSIHPIG